jgi:hypothetical protein
MIINIGEQLIQEGATTPCVLVDEDEDTSTSMKCTNISVC